MTSTISSHCNFCRHNSWNALTHFSFDDVWFVLFSNCFLQFFINAQYLDITAWRHHSSKYERKNSELLMMWHVHYYYISHKFNEAKYIILSCAVKWFFTVSVLNITAGDSRKTYILRQHERGVVRACVLRRNPKLVDNSPNQGCNQGVQRSRLHENYLSVHGLKSTLTVIDHLEITHHLVYMSIRVYGKSAQLHFRPPLTLRTCYVYVLTIIN